MSLRLQLLGTFALVLIGTLVLATWLTYRHALNKIETEMVAAIDVGARIAHNAVDDSEEVVNPRRRLELLVADFDGDRHLQAYIVEPDGTVAVRSKVASEGRHVPQWFLNLLAWKSDPIELEMPAEFANMGRLTLEADPRNEIGEVWSDILLFAKILSFFGLTGILVTLYILGRALRPLQRLTAAFQRIGAGDYRPRISESGSRELVELARGFNHMAGRLSEMEQRNDRLRSHLDTFQEEERTELARNLHDDVSPLLFCIDVDAMTVRRQGESAGDDIIVERAKAIQAAVDELKVNVKGILSDLRPSSLHALTLKDSIDDVAAFWIARHPSVEILNRVPLAGWGAKIDDAILSIVRESVSNALKHARPTRIAISAIDLGASVALRVDDNGGGLKRPITDGGFGILGMKERASRLGGKLSVTRTADGSGVLVEADLPIEGAKVDRTNTTDQMEMTAACGS